MTSSIRLIDGIDGADGIDGTYAIDGSDDTDSIDGIDSTVVVLFFYYFYSAIKKINILLLKIIYTDIVLGSGEFSTVIVEHCPWVIFCLGVCVFDV